MPVLVAALLWGPACEQAQVCWYLDNEAGKSAFLKAYGATEIADGMVQTFTEHEMDLQIKSWFARVPSASNIADAPSRHEDSELRDRGALKVAIQWQAIRGNHRLLGFQKWGDDISPLLVKNWIAAATHVVSE